MKRPKIATLLLGTGVLLSGLLAVPSDSVTLSTADSSSACVQAAGETVDGAWTCAGDTLSYRDNGKEKVKKVTSDAQVIELSNWDKKSPYAAWVSRNVHFGVGSNEWGVFWIRWDQAFSGWRFRWQGTIRYKRGKGINPAHFYADIRKSDAGPDSWWVGSVFEPGEIWPGHRTSRTRWDTSATSVYSKGTYSQFHDDLHGKFWSDGRSFFMGTLHTGRAKRKSKGSYLRYCQVPWQDHTC